MGKNNVELLKIAKKHLGQGGAIFRKYCGSAGAWCCAFVTYIFHEGDDSPLFYGGKKVVYCPTAIQWCKANLAQIPIYLALPMDIIFFDWNNNNVPDHIGFVRERKSDQEIYTIEGNTSGGIVAEKLRPNKYVIGCFRPAFPAKFDTSKPLEIDGFFGYNSIACLQKALQKSGHYKDEIDGILGKNTVKALQDRVGVAQDGSWGTKTSKAVQKMIGTDVDGAFGQKSVKALQKWINKQNNLTWQQKATKWARETAKSEKYHYVRFSMSDSDTQRCPICHPRKRKIGGNCIWFAFACWHHGGGLQTKCSCGVLTNQMYDKMFDMTEKKASELASERISKKVEIIMDRGKAIPQDWIKEGDIGVLFKGKDYYHTIYCEGDGKYSDCTSGRTPNIKADRKMSKTVRNNLKMIIRYDGK